VETANKQRECEQDAHQLPIVLPTPLDLASFEPRKELRTNEAPTRGHSRKPDRASVQTPGGWIDKDVVWRRRRLSPLDSLFHSL
jgi:hypothetical protein